MSDPHVELETLSDVVALLKSKDAREYGVGAETFRSNGMASIHAVATGLRARGYEVEVFADGGGERLRLLSVPAVGAKRRKRQQGTLFELPAANSGPYNEAA